MQIRDRSQATGAPCHWGSVRALFSKIRAHLARDLEGSVQGPDSRDQTSVSVFCLEWMP